MAKVSRRTRGDGALYQRADGMWIGSVEMGVTPDGKRRRKVVTSSTHAGALEKLRKARRDVETHGVVPTRSLTVGAWLDRWLTEIVAQRVKPRTLDGYNDKVRIIKASIGNVRLDKLTLAHVRQMHHNAADGRSSTTAMHCHRVLRTALQDAMREGVVLRNVATLERAPARDSVESRPLTLEETATFLRSVQDEPLAARWALALIAGMRQGEVLGLTWEKVNFEDRTLDLAWQLQHLTWRHGCGDRPCGRKRGVNCPAAHLGIPAGVPHRVLTGAYVLTPPKRGKRRVIPMPPFVEAVLRSRMEAAKFDPNPYGLVFARPDGMPIAPSKDNAAWHAILEGAGLPSIPLHAARHTAATHHLERGVDALVVQSLMGHSDVQTTRDYQTVDISLARTAIDELAAAVAAAITG